MPPLLWLAFCLILQAVSDKCEEEVPLPTTLPLGHNHEYHLHGRYRANFNETRKIRFSVDQQSYFRAYLSEHSVVDVDLYLSNSTGYYIDYSIEMNEEEMIAHTLAPGDYSLEVVPFAVDSDHETIKYDCVFVQMEIAISSVAKTLERERDDRSFPRALPNSFDLSGLEEGRPYHYKSQPVGTNWSGIRPLSVHVNVPSGPLPNGGQTIVKKYDLHLIPKAGTNPLFKFTALLGYNFLTGGSLRILLEPTNANYTGDIPFCTTSEAHYQDCISGSNDGINLNVISTTLTSGNYTLWIYDWTQHRLKRTPSLDDPISLELDINQLHSDETFVSCDAMPLPASLNTPGLLDDTGFLSFREQVLLDLEAKIETTTFVLQEPSIFRAWSEAHRIDVDWEIIDALGNVLGRTYRGAMAEESFVMQLKAKERYTLNIKYYSNLDAQFCEKLWIEIMIQPLTEEYKFNYCGRPDQIPAFPNLKGVSTTVKMPGQAYTYKWKNNHTEVIGEVLISPTSNMRFEATLDSQFLDGLSLSLVAVNGTGRIQPVTYHYRGGQRIGVFLTGNTQYVLTIRGGPHQFRANQSLFSPCTSFYFDLTLETMTSWWSNVPALLRRCPWTPSLPTDLTGPRFLGTSNRVHFQEWFKVPDATGFEKTLEIPFTVRVKSLLRAYTEPRKSTDVDIDFVLLENGKDLNHTVKEYGEEKITQILMPGKTYLFKVEFYADFSVLPGCTTFNLEFEIAPIHDDLPGNACITSLPVNRVIYARNLMSEFNDEKTYTFAQSKNAFLQKIRLEVVTRSVVFARILVAYDFVWNDLSVRVMNEGGSQVALGDNDFNKNQILSLALPTGNYTIEIFEPSSLEDAALHHCSDFNFVIGIAPSHQDMFPDESDTENDEDDECSKLYLPPTFNDIPYLSYYNDNTVHFSTFVRLSNKAAESSFFEILKPSIIRVFVPQFQTFDVDLYLYKTSGSFGSATRVLPHIAKSTSYHGDETIYMVIPAGGYEIEFRTYFRPKNVKCLNFPVEFGIAPLTYINDNIALPAAQCAGAAPKMDATLTLGQKVHKEFSRIPKLNGADFTLGSEFRLTKASLFTAELQYAFFTGHLTFLLEGENIQSPYLSAPSKKTIQAYVGQDIAFFDHLLYPGSYTLILGDNTNYTQSYCNKFSLDYHVQVGYIPENYCDDADTLPTDVFSYRGRSRYYGGPQARDGNVHISGKHFKLPDRKSHNNIEFYVREPSFVRFWAKFQDETKNDVDFLLWKNNSFKKLISASAGLSSVESHMTFLEAQPEPYVLDVFLYARAVAECNFLHFEFVIETNDTVVADMICPSPLPAPLLPPATITINQPEFEFFGDLFVFTSQYVATHKATRWGYDEVSYSIAIEVQDNHKYELRASLGYNFLWSDFSIEIYKGLQKKATSLGDLAVTPDTWDDFRSLVETTLEGPGTYTLKIVEKIYSKNIKAGLAGTCEKFSFAINVDRVGNSGEPGNLRIISVTPPESRAVQINAYFMVQIRFSSSLGPQANLPNLAEWLQSEKVIGLVTRFRTEYPLFAEFNPQTTLLTVTFLSLRPGQEYKLEINAPKFKNAAGQATQNYTRVHSYTTVSCDCSEHGECRQNGTIRGCVCEYPYAGETCEACTLGYHKSGTTCVRNVACSANSCNGHGDCSADEGYPVCACHKEYETIPGVAGGQCATCHTGYTGYPDCVKTDDSRNIHCEAPLLPSTLDTAAYLKIDGTMHLQGDYYIDVNHYGHDMDFTIEKTSWIRVYTEPHEVDIDLWLFQNLPDKTTKIVGYAISFNDEETLVLKLQPGKYTLNFQFLLFREYTTCPTFNLELAIAPETVFNAQVAAYSQTACAKQVQPDITMPGSSIPTTPWSFFKECSALTNAVETADARDFYRFNFVVPRLNQQQAVFELQLGYLFLTGDIASRIEITGTNTTLGYGYNGYNQHFLKHTLDPGSYTLVLYMPAPLNKTQSPCSPYSIKLSTKWITPDEDVFNCEFSELPDSFDDISFHGEKDHIELQDQFLIESFVDDNTDFTVNTASVIRVDAQSVALISYGLQKQNGASWETIKTVLEGDLFYDGLVPGTKYRLRFSYGFLSLSRAFCPTLNLLVMIVPKSDLAVTATSCPSGQQTVPNIRNGHVTLPFTFDGIVNPRANPWEVKEQVFYGFREFGNVVAEWTLSWTDNVYFEADIGSDFMTANMRIEVKPPGRAAIHSHRHSAFHRADIEEEFTPGEYTIRIIQADRSSISPPCTKFSFTMKIVSLTAWKADLCGTKDLDTIPPNFNSLMYWGATPELRVSSPKWRIPERLTNNTFVVSHMTYFNITTESLIRVYVGLHPIDIDIALFALQNKVNAIARGQDLNGEESFVTVIPAGSYYLRFMFWNLDGEVPSCPNFNMQIQLTPTSDLPTRKQLCTSGGGAQSSWPSVLLKPTENDFPWRHTYDGYFQQTDHNQFSHPLKEYEFDFATDIDIHIELGYNFLLGDLVLSLTSETGTVITGINKPSRNVLTGQKLAAGKYILKIYEATQNVEAYIACSGFTISFLIDKAKTSDSREDSRGVPFPESLDGIEFLRYSDELHLQEPNYVMYLGANPFARRSPRLAISVRKASMLRISTGHLDSLLVKYGNNVDSFSDLIVRLEPGDHNITFTPTNFRFSVYLVANIQLSLMPINDAVQFATQLCAPQLKPWTAPELTIRPTDGLFQYSDYDARLTAQQIATKGRLFTMPLEINEESVVSVQLMFQHLIGRLVVGLEDSYTKRVGFDDWNMNDLNALVRPGKFNLTIDHPATYPTALPCGEFGIRISVSPKGSGADRVDCSESGLFPWDLNSRTGGSVPYGGPMLAGNLNLWHDRFLLTGALLSAFTVEADSLVSVFIHQHEWTSRITVEIIDVETQAVLRPLIQQNNNVFQNRLLWKVPANTGQSKSKEYVLRLSYRASDWAACSTFTFGLVIKPLNEVTTSLQGECSAHGAKIAIPTKMTTSPLVVNSFLTSADIAAGSGTGFFRHDIDFSISDDSAIDATIQYNPLYSAFRLRLYRVINATTARAIGNGDWEPVDNTAASLTQIIDSDVRYQDGANYRLSITQVPQDHFPATSAFCFPFRLSLQVENTHGANAFVRYVEPGSGDHFDPLRAIWIEIRFSHALHQNTPNSPITRDAASQQYVSGGVVLVEMGSNVQIAPSRAMTPDDNPIPDDFTRWLFEFPHDKFSAGATYRLELVSNKLFAPDRTQMEMRGNHTYTMSPANEACSGFGHWNGVKCICNPGSHRTGATCADCETGFNVDKNGECVRPAGCEADTCGCGPASTPNHCVAVGQCSHVEGTSTVSCLCPTNYAGDHCESCAVGYSDYKAGCLKSCGSGTWNEQEKRCKCTGNWMGELCDKCKPGFMGTNCETATSSNLATVVGIILGALVLVVLLAVGAWWWRMRSGSEYSRLAHEQDDFMDGMIGGKKGNVAELDKFGSSDSDSPSDLNEPPSADPNEVQFSSTSDDD